MSNIGNFEKEKNYIYMCEYIKGKEELLGVAVYQMFCSDFLNSLDNKDYETIYKQLLTKKLYDHLANVSSLKKEITAKKMMKDYFNILLNTKEEVGEASLTGATGFIIRYKLYLNDIIDELYWVDYINKMNLSFDSKTSIVIILNDSFDNIDLCISSLGGLEETEDIRDELKKKIIDYTKNIDTDNFNIDIFDMKIREIIKDFVKEKIDNNEIDFNNIQDHKIKKLFLTKNEKEKKILLFFIPYALSELYEGLLEQNELVEVISKELNIGKISARIELYKFAYKWLNEKYISPKEKQVNNVKKYSLKK